MRKAIIPAAGLGTRFLPATKAQPKEMLPLVDKPVIQYVVEEAVASGIRDILIVTGRGKRALEDHFDRSVELELLLDRKGASGLLASVRSIADMADIHYVRQKEPLGLGHAVLTGRAHIGDEPFAVLLGDEIFAGDVPCLAQVLDFHRRTGAGAVVGVREVPRAEVSRYGIVSGQDQSGEAMRLDNLVEKPSPEQSPSCLAVLGRYVLPPEVFDVLEATRPGHGGEIQLTDALGILARRGDVWGLRVRGHRFDLGEPMGFLKATVECALGRDDLGKEFRAYLTETLLGRGRATDSPPDASKRHAG